MYSERIKEIRRSLRERRPLIHCITNPISITQCANTILSAGARPMMAEHPDEAAAITATAGAVMLNLGNITDVRMKSMLISAAAAGQNGIPFVLDVCGASCLANRREYALKLIRTAVPSVIKGNYSEIMSLYNKSHRSSGVDADSSLDTDALDSAAAGLAENFNTVILASGRTDIVTDGKTLLHIDNGTPQLSQITGTGCMQGALCAAYLSGGSPLDAAFSACAVLGICGELAQTDRGSGTFFVNLMDALSTVTDDQTDKKLRIRKI